MTIPEIRREILRIADLPEGQALRPLLLKWERELHRRPYVRKANPHCRSATGKTARAIRAYAKANPDAGYQTMSALFSVNTGRISEILAGKRT